MTAKLKLTLYLSMVVILVAFGVWGVIKTIENDAEAMESRERAPQAERAGEIAINNNTVYLWTFDFEGKRCLWATSHYAPGLGGGLTCWEQKP